ncbi:MAG: hypothetical protein QXK42_05505 [Candidatus Korarchaeum sp.]
MPSDVEKLLYSEWNVRRIIAMNPNTPVEVLAKLAGDEDWSVRNVAVWNLKTPKI